MAIKTVKYKADSIIYFKGDVADRVYILKKGSIVTKAKDLKTNEDQLTMIKVGEFIGVKNVISGQPYSETVSTLTDSELLVFYKEDFEKFIMGNSRVMMQTLAVFSNQLRRIHNDIKELTNLKDHTVNKSNTEKDFFDLGEYFMKSGKVNHGSYCLKKYLEVYPDGKYVDQAQQYLETGSYVSEEEYQEEEDNTLLYYQEGQNYLSEQNYMKASECFQKVIESPSGGNKEDAIYFNGASLFKLKEYKRCIMNFSDFLTKYKSSSRLNEVLFYVGCSYKKIGDINQSTIFLQQVMKKAKDTPLAHEAMKVLKG